MKIFKSLCLSILLILSSCAYLSSSAEETGATVQAAEPSADTAGKNDDYIVQPGDILEISVWKESDLQRDVLVRPDGGLNFPLVGEIEATGKTVAELREVVTKALSRFVPDPVVNVAVRQGTGNKIYVIGKVGRPGEFVTNRNIDVMQALSLAGGPTPFASVNKIKVLRRKNGVLESIPFKYSKVMKGQNLEQNIILRSGDIVVVP